jgi:hypothetical protein
MLLAMLSEANWRNYICKVDRVYIEGCMKYASYRRNGATIQTAAVVVWEVVLPGSPSGAVRKWNWNRRRWSCEANGAVVRGGAMAQKSSGG